jgi:hypothetical protein
MLLCFLRCRVCSLRAEAVALCGKDVAAAGGDWVDFGTTALRQGQPFIAPASHLISSRVFFCILLSRCMLLVGTSSAIMLFVLAPSCSLSLMLDEGEESSSAPEIASFPYGGYSASRKNIRESVEAFNCL